MRESLNLLLSPLLLWKCIIIWSSVKWVSHLLLRYKGWTILVWIVWMILRKLKLLFFKSEWLRTCIFCLSDSLGLWFQLFIQRYSRLPKGTISHLAVKFVFAWEENHSWANRFIKTFFEMLMKLVIIWLLISTAITNVELIIGQSVFILFSVLTCWFGLAFAH